MKRLPVIIVSLVLSLTIVHSGAGLAVIECLCDHTVSIGVPGDGRCVAGMRCHSESSCDKTTVIKLQPTLNGGQQCKIKKITTACLSQFLKKCTESDLRAVPLPCRPGLSLVTHGPPRGYLAKIRVLVI